MLVEADRRDAQHARVLSRRWIPPPIAALRAILIGFLVLASILAPAVGKIPSGYFVKPTVLGNGAGPVSLRHQFSVDFTLGQTAVGLSRTTSGKRYEAGLGFWYLTNIPLSPVSEVPGQTLPPLARTILEQNIPNPFNPLTTIVFTIARPGQVSLKLYDLQGKLMTTLVEEELEIGEHRCVFQPRDLPSGVYLYRLETADTVLNRRLTLLK